MTTKKEVRKINAAKNEFVEWLEKNEAQQIIIFNPLDLDFDYYRSISGTCHKGNYNMYFMIHLGAIKIEGHIGPQKIKSYSIEEFLTILI